MANTLVEILTQRTNPGAFDLDNMRRFEEHDSIVDACNGFDVSIETGPDKPKAATSLHGAFYVLDSYKGHEFDDFIPIIECALANPSEKGHMDFVAKRKYATEQRISMTALGYTHTEFIDLKCWQIKHTESSDGSSRNFSSGVKLLPQATRTGQSKEDFIVGLKAAILNDTYEDFERNISTTYATTTGTSVPERYKLETELEKRGLSAHAADFDGLSTDFRLEAYDALTAATNLSYDQLKPIITGFTIATAWDRKKLADIKTGIENLTDAMDTDTVLNAAKIVANKRQLDHSFADRVSSYKTLVEVGIDSELAETLFIYHDRGTISEQTANDIQEIDNDEQVRNQLISYFTTTRMPLNFGHNENNPGEVGPLRLGLLASLCREGYDASREVYSVMEIPAPRIVNFNTATIANAYLGLEKETAPA